MRLLDDIVLEEIVQKHKEYLMHAFEPLYIREPFVIVKGSGSTLIDSNGKKYIDWWASNSVAIYGHNHPALVEALKKQADMLVYYSYELYTVPVIKLAEELANINPFGYKKSFFMTTGAEAVEGALRLARKYTKKAWWIGLYGGFHGRTYGAVSLTSFARKYGKKGIGPFVPCVTLIPSYYCYRCFLGLEYPDCDLRCARLLEDAIEFATDTEVSAFIAEPAQGGGGNLFPPDDYFRAIKKILEKYDALFIADEIITSLGRTGKLFAMEHYGVKPDIIVISKTLGGGVPISAIITRDEIAESFQGESFYESTYAGNPLCASVALRALQLNQELKLPERSEKMGNYLMHALMDIAEEHEIIGDVQGKGLLIGVELVKNRKTKEPAAEEAIRLRYETAKRGLILPSGKGIFNNRIRINPPLVIEKEDIDKGIEILEESLKVVEKQLKGES
jgi:4-aminobutyrate aminotransferase-like enzyme